MPWIDPIDFNDGDPFTSAQWNNFVRGNLNATAPGVATSPGNLIVTNGKNQLVERQWARAYYGAEVVSEAEWPSDPSDEEDNGPSLTFQHGGSFLLLYDCRIVRDSGSGTVNYAPEITDGPGVLPNVYNMAVRSTLSSHIRTGAHCFVSGVEPGITTVTMKYGSTPGNGAQAVGRYAQRRLTVLPL